MKPTILFVISSLLFHISFSQSDKFNQHGISIPGRLQHSSSASYKTSGVGTDYDVKYYRLALRINPDTSIGAYIAGSVTTYFTTVQNNFTTIKFDFISNLNADSIKYHGVNLVPAAFVEDVDTLKITVPTIPLAGTLDSITVFYKGVPQQAPWGTGFVRSTHNSQNYIYTLSEPYSASYWWPCKLDVTDKADSLDLIISTPVGFKAVGNGTLVSETTNASGVTAFWKHRYAIPAYLVCTAVANYQVYNSSPVNVGGTMMPVYHYFFPETNNTSIQSSVDGVTGMISAFSNWFGDYPFKNEKYGHYEFGFGGGMEHSTFSGMSAGAMYAWDIIAHELGHQWFGDGTTCKTWGDIWINEGFAQWTEIIAAEKVPALNGYLAGKRSGIKSNALAYNIETTFRTNVSSIATIFDPSPYIYDRGAMILNMLRLTLGDTKFFTAIQNYTADPLLKYKNSATADVKGHMENVSGIDLTSFFDNWIYNNGHAVYSIQWGNNNKSIQLQLAQTKTPGSTASYFDMPVPIRIQGASFGQDTVVIIYDRNGIMNYDNNGVLTSTGNNQISFNLSFVPTTVTFDPDNLSLATASVGYQATLPLENLQLTGKKTGEVISLTWKGIWSGMAKNMEVQKSNDGINFRKLNTQNFLNPQSGISYNNADPSPFHGNNYYRIRLEMEDGTHQFSNSIVLKGSAVVIRMWPNPASSNLSVQFADKASTEITNISIYAAAGKLCYTSKSTGKENIEIDVRNWPAGIYTAQISSATKTFSEKIFIQH